uniref:F-box/LRR-repeat protein 6-like isoform X1 n=1 Tax=Styela clava TaxID=7725 RepID=UPI001939E513|nr:F-box/LRR-repeat protein 6-like isoform X1 [Styela clava]
MDTKRTQLDENNNETPPLKRRRNNLCNIVSLPGPGETQLRHKRAKRVQSQWAYLPAEVLVNIFGYLVNQDTGALPCLLRLSKVCRHWRMTANIPFLWSNLHFAPYVLKSQREFKNNVKSFRLMAGAHFCSVENLVCDELPMVAPIIIKTISNYARRIRVLSIQRCGSISMKNCLQAIVDRHLSSLQEFCICHTSIPTFDIRKILSGAGEQLTRLVMINPEFPRNLQISLNHLKNLTVLKIECGRTFRISNIKKLKPLRVLHLINMHLDSSDCLEVDFPELEDLNLSVNDYFYVKETDNRMLTSIFSKSPNIRSVNLHNRRMNVYHLIPSLENCRKIEFLDISGFYGSSFSTLLLHVSGSLKEFHLDNYGDLNAELYSCVDIMYWQSISILSLRYTNISARVLELLLHYCLTNMQVLNLDVCHCLPKCLRKRWEKDQLAQIKESLRQLHQQGRRHT